MKRSLLGLGLIAAALTATAVNAEVVYLYEERFDSSLGTMTATNGAFAGNSWHFDATCPAAIGGPHSIPGTARFSRPDDCDDYGESDCCPTDTDLLTSPTLDTTACAGLTLSYTYLLDYEEGASFDRARVEISIDGGPFQVLADNSAARGRGPETRAGEAPAAIAAGIENSGVWLGSSFDLTGVQGSTLAVRFVGELYDDQDNSGEGFVVDDVVVYCQVPLQAVPAASPLGLALLALLLAGVSFFVLRRLRRA